MLLLTDGADSCIVSWIDVPAWTAGSVPLGSHTFQVILAAPTAPSPTSTAISRIPFRTMISWSHRMHTARSVSCTRPTLICPETRVKFSYPDTVTYQIHDLAAQAVSNPNSEGFFILVGNALEPWP